MVIVDTRTDKAHENLSAKEASRILGVCDRTVRRWKAKGVKQVYNFFEIYFNCQKHKQKMGTKKSPPVKKIKQVQNNQFRRG